MLVHKQQQRETHIMEGSSAQLDFGLEEHMPISAIGARARLIGLVLFVLCIDLALLAFGFLAFGTSFHSTLGKPQQAKL